MDARLVEGGMARPSQPLVRPYESADRNAVVALWSACDLLRPWNDPDHDIACKLAHDAAGFLVAEVGGRVVGSVMAGFDGHRGWVNYLAVDPAHRRAGVGSVLMKEAERVLARAGCPKVNLQVRATNEPAVGFYEAIGYARDDVVSMGKRLSADAAAEGRGASPTS